MPVARPTERLVEVEWSPSTRKTASEAFEQWLNYVEIKNDGASSERLRFELDEAIRKTDQFYRDANKDVGN